MPSEAELQELLDKQALHELNARWARAVDRCDEEAFLACYHPGAIEHHGHYKGSPEGFVEKVFPRLRLANCYHFITSELFDVQGDVAFGDIYCPGYTDALIAQRFDLENPPPPTGHALMGAGRYLDRYERRNGEWRIARRVVVIDWPMEEGRREDWGGPLGTQDKDDPMYSYKY